eukprot:1159727-Pelagomonas_calceolata.AAC.10
MLLLRTEPPAWAAAGRVWPAGRGLGQESARHFAKPLQAQPQDSRWCISWCVELAAGPRVWLSSSLSSSVHVKGRLCWCDWQGLT